ncbi:MAG TPA: AAA family ATPase [Candidatus Saccharimonadales bacterium]|nr:AAA family ATPase [Candidatus Saccharimonadales bacterium]
MNTTVEAKQALQFTLDATQQQAIDLSCDTSKRVVGVTGPAGTGKTTILQQTYNTLVENGYRTALASPTGKAAKRIYEVTGIEASTVHRLLEFTHPGDPDPKTGKPVSFSYPKRTRSNPLELDVVLVDEYSMVNNEVHRSIFDALPPGGCIRVFGDNNQLPPIEEDKRLMQMPSMFMQLLDKFPSVTLDTVHRQGKDSGILLNLQAILKARMPTRNDQWNMTFTERPVDVLRDILIDGMDEGLDFCSFDNQIITPQNTSWVGTQKLNAMIQAMFHNRMDPCVFVPRHNWVKGENDEKGGLARFFVGDKVIITSNMYDLHVFNGESGRIIEFDRDDGIVIDFGDREQVIPSSLMVLNRYGRTVEIDPRKNVDLGYAITTHKSQGSEYKRVIYILNKSTGFMQNRRNFYTACSRGREHVHVITDQRSIGLSLNKSGN